VYCTNRLNSAADGRVKGPALRDRVKTCADPLLCAGLEQHFSLSSRPQESWAFGPPKAMKNGFCSATTLPGSAALPFVISTEAQRSGEICGFSLPMSAGSPALGHAFRLYPRRKRRVPHICLVLADVGYRRSLPQVRRGQTDRHGYPTFAPALPGFPVTQD
jgi:hypothetical protein